MSDQGREHSMHINQYASGNEADAYEEGYVNNTARSQHSRSYLFSFSLQ